MDRRLVFNRYELREKIGQGAVGQVFEAFDRHRKKSVALKIIDGNAREDVAARFLREAQVTAELLLHPNIIDVYEFGEDGGRLFIAMQLLDGADLKTLIRAEPAIGLMDKLGLMLQICDGVSFAHSKGIVHRDLTPGNIHVLPNGQIKIMDFGLVRLASSDLTRSGAIIGTPSYMSPEQAEGRTVDPPADVFSLGAVFYELLTYKKSFQADSIIGTLFQVINEPHEPLQNLAPQLTPALVEIIHQALLKEPEERFPDAGALHHALVKYIKKARVRAAAEDTTPLLTVLEQHTRKKGAAPEDVSTQGDTIPDGVSTKSDTVPEGVSTKGDTVPDECPPSEPAVRYTSLAGELKQTPLSVLLRFCTDNSKSGALHLRRGPIEKRLFFVGGRLCSTATNSPRETLGQFLIRSGYVSEIELHDALMEQERNYRLLGKIIVARGHLTDALLKNLLQLKSEETIYDCFLWPDGEFAFEDGHVPDEIYPSLSLDVPTLVREAEGRIRKWKEIRKLFPSSLTTFRATKTGLRTTDSQTFEDRRLIELIGQNKNLAEIALEVHGVEFYVASRLLELLNQHLIEVAEAPEEPAYEEKVQELRDLLRDGLTHFKAGRYEYAARALEAALVIDPQSKAYLYLEKIKKSQAVPETEEPLPLDFVPLLNVAVDKLVTKTLTPEESFVLSRANGDWNIAAILQICPMSEREAKGIFRKLLASGVLRLEPPDTASAAS